MAVTGSFAGERKHREGGRGFRGGAGDGAAVVGACTEVDNGFSATAFPF